MKFNELLRLHSTFSEGQEIPIGSKSYECINGVLKAKSLLASKAQAQTQNTFGFKWKQENSFDSCESLKRMKTWLIDRYGCPEQWLTMLTTKEPIVLDAGCGAGMSAFEYWGSLLDKIKYVGIDISEAVDVAKKRLDERGYSGLFMQDSIACLPFSEPLFDIIFSEGVMHHTDSTKDTFDHLSTFLKPGGLFMIYVYRKKGPIREFTDDYIRQRLQERSPEEAWNDLKSLTKLGISLGERNIEIDIPENIDLLEIPAGKINLQRLFYWNVFKAFYDPNLTFDEMHHINFDWYAPKNAHRHTIDEVRKWCQDNHLEIRHEKEESAGITCIAQKL